jgi:hypothetical protein
VSNLYNSWRSIGGRILKDDPVKACSMSSGKSDKAYRHAPCHPPSYTSEKRSSASGGGWIRWGRGEVHVCTCPSYFYVTISKWASIKAQLRMQVVIQKFYRCLFLSLKWSLWVSNASITWSCIWMSILPPILGSSAHACGCVGRYMAATHGWCMQAQRVWIC